MAIVMCDRTDKDGIRHLFAWEVKACDGNEVICSCVGKINHRAEEIWLSESSQGRAKARIYVGRANETLDIWLYPNGELKEESHKPFVPSQRETGQTQSFHHQGSY